MYMNDLYIYIELKGYLASYLFLYLSIEEIIYLYFYLQIWPF